MKVYWSKCGHGHGNFGDKVTPLLLKHAGVPVEWAPPEHAELIGVGSILEKIPDTFRGTIWTTGFMHESSRRTFANARVLALRGKLTIERVCCSAPEAITLGDAGLLCGDLAPTVARKHKLGIIPHFVDIADPFVKALADRSSDVRVIDICAETSDVMRSVAECENIISSSLHGLILADSLGIPNRWMELNRGTEIVTGAGFKYRDYYSVFGRTATPLQLTADSSLDLLLASIEPVPDFQGHKAALRRTLTDIKEHVRPFSAEELQAQRAAHAEWEAKRGELFRTLNHLIPAGSAILVADDEQLRPDMSAWRTLPFTERNGLYWGPPATGDTAVEEVIRQLQHGVQWLVVVWPMFWLFDRFPQLTRCVNESFTACCDTDACRIFRAREQPLD